MVVAVTLPLSYTRLERSRLIKEKEKEMEKIRWDLWKSPKDMLMGKPPSEGSFKIGDRHYFIQEYASIAFRHFGKPSKFRLIEWLANSESEHGFLMRVSFSNWRTEDEARESLGDN